MKPDEKAIHDAYGDALKQLFSVYFVASSIALTQPEKDEALVRFRRGLGIARAARDTLIEEVRENHYHYPKGNVPCSEQS